MDAYLKAVRDAEVGTSTEDGNGYKLTKLAADEWKFREPSEDAPGYGEYVIDDTQAADVVESIFPGSFGSPETI